MALSGVQKTVLVTLAAIALVIGAVVNKVSRPAALDREQLSQVGIFLFDSPRGIPEVDMLSADGGSWGKEDLLGQWDLLFFGYTFCPDICPTTLAELKQVAAALPEASAEQLRVTMVSVDPNRDTPSRCSNTWASSMPGFTALPGNPRNWPNWPAPCRLPISNLIPVPKTIWSTTVAKW